MSLHRYTDPLSVDAWTLLAERYEESDQCVDDAIATLVDYLLDSTNADYVADSRPGDAAHELCRNVTRRGLVGWYQDTAEYETTLEDMANGDRELP